MLREQKEREKEEDRRRAADAELRSYDRLLSKNSMKTNKDDGNDSDEFM